MTNAEYYESLKIGLDDTFKFHCTQCGQCCINREDILLNPRDVFRAAKELEMTPKEFLSTYCEAYLGDNSHMPIVRFKPMGKNLICPMLRPNGKCRIQKGKPTICAMFPIGRIASVNKENGTKKIEYILQEIDCGDESESCTVKEWLTRFGIPIDDEFFTKWQEAILEIGPKLHKCMNLEAANKITSLKIVTFVFAKLYVAYDMNKEFYPQFIENYNSVLPMLDQLLGH